MECEGGETSRMYYRPRSTQWMADNTRFVMSEGTDRTSSIPSHSARCDTAVLQNMEHECGEASGMYCRPRSIQWTPDDTVLTMHENSDRSTSIPRHSARGGSAVRQQVEREGGETSETYYQSHSNEITADDAVLAIYEATDRSTSIQGPTSSFTQLLKWECKRMEQTSFRLLKRFNRTVHPPTNCISRHLTSIHCAT